MCNINSPETGSREKNELQMKKTKLKTTIQLFQLLLTIGKRFTRKELKSAAREIIAFTVL